MLFRSYFGGVNMSTRELCKLDGQSPAHAGQGQVPAGHLALAGVHPGLSVPRNDPAPQAPSAVLETVLADTRRAHAEGRMGERQMLDLLARHCGVQQVDLGLTPPDPDLVHRFDPAVCLRNECLPWRETDDTIWIATSRPERFAAAQAVLAKSHGGTKRMRPVIAPRSDLQSALATLRRPALTARMACRTAPALSARKLGHWPLAMALVLILGLLIAGLGAGAAPLATLLAWAAIATVATASLLKLGAAATHLSHRPVPPPPAGDDDDLPVISILVPLYRETDVAGALLRRLARLDYPRHLLDVLLVLEEHDDMTRDALTAASLPPWMRIVTVPDGRPRTKPRALNYALDFAIGDIVGVYDAEDAPDPDQLRKVVAGFAAAPHRTVCLQGALDYYNARDNWITRCFTIEYSTWFRLVMPGMARLGFAVPLGGTTIFLRRAALEEMGGWDAHNVTEDADLGIRLARFGYRTQVIDTTTGEEASRRPVQWIRQRSRWLKGYMMTYAVHMRRPLALLRELGAWQFIGFQVHFLTALTHFMLAPLLWLFWLVIFGVDLPLITLDTAPAMRGLALAFLGFELMIMALGAIATRRPGRRFLWLWLPSLHLYWPMGSIAMWKAMIEMVARPFYWDKTPHGLSAPPPRQDAVPIAPESSLSRVTKALEM